MRIAASWRRFDWGIFFATSLLTVIGLAGIWSVALSFDPPDFGNLRKQTIALGLGFALFFLLAQTNYQTFRRLTKPLGFGAILILIAVLIFGTTIRGTRGWFSISGFSLQPVELVKIILPLLLAKHFSDYAFRIDGKVVVKGFAPVALLALLVLFQPDFGSALLLIAVYAGLLVVSGIPRRSIFALAAAGAVAAIAIWLSVLAPYQKERVLTFINPHRDPLGRGYNLAQSIIAVGSGQWFGRGLGSGTQSQLRFLPESQTDFLFAVLAEELGFVFVVVTVILYGIIMERSLRLARQAEDNFTSFLVVGCTLTIMIQAVANMAMNVGLLPVAGVPLPLISYGGSSLIATYGLLGLIQSVALHRSSLS